MAKEEELVGLHFRRKTHIEGIFRQNLLHNPEVQKIWNDEYCGFFAHLLDSTKWMNLDRLYAEVLRYRKEFPLDTINNIENVETILIALGKLIGVDIVEAKYF